MRTAFSALACGFLLTAPVFAGDDGLTGNWKLSIFDGGQQISFWLLRMDSKDGKLTVTATALKDAPKAKAEDVKLVGDTFTIKFRATVNRQNGPQEITLSYEGKLPKPGAKKIFGSVSQGGTPIPAILEATNAKTPFDLDRELLQRTPSDPKALDAILDVIDRGKENKLDAKDLQELVNSSLKTAELYGPRYQLTHSLRLLGVLKNQKTYAPVAVETARVIAKQIDAKMPLETQLQILSTAADVLRSGDQKEEAKTLETRVEKLEGQAYDTYHKDALNFKPVKFAGRKAKSERAVLVELFTGAQCPPCVAADMAFDGLEKTYAPGEVVLLQYHMHIPRPEPMSNADSAARFEYYAEKYVKKVGGTPATLFNGKPDAPGGGFRDDGPEKYKEYCEVVNKLLESTTPVKLSAKATRNGDKIDIEATVKDLDKPGDNVRLRLALVEDWVRFKGSNQLQYHHRVVRALPGGATGVSVKAKDFEHKASVDLETLRKTLNKYLDEDYPDGPRPMRLRNLHVVAFVQNDETTEILQAIDVAIKE